MFNYAWHVDEFVTQTERYAFRDRFGRSIQTGRLRGIEDTDSGRVQLDTRPLVCILDQWSIYKRF